LRYADILLLAAEVLNENGKSAEALPYLNRVRARARKTAPNIPGLIVLPDVTVTAKNELREKIYAERRIELAMEQHRWFDLARWGRLEQAMKAAGKNFVSGKHELLPIPQTEVDLAGGKIGQNRGY
jgi:starch-binding outer membrane protein, SusD/RagB family